MEDKKRLDLLLLERGLASTRTKAQELIRGGHIIVEGKRIRKAGEMVDPEARVEADRSEHPFVSRGGLKLEAAIKSFSLDVANKVVLDVGLSTGGFSDCLLRQGVARVYGVDVGTAQLADSLKQEPKLRYWENTHIKDLHPAMLGEAVDLLVADLSFISLEKVIPLFQKFLKPKAQLLLLVKPQFELGPQALNSKGIVVSTELHRRALESISSCCIKFGYQNLGTVESPITGGEGNVEYFLHAIWPGSPT